jgi:hypothetical protein
MQLYNETFSAGFITGQEALVTFNYQPAARCSRNFLITLKWKEERDAHPPLHHT